MLFTDKLLICGNIFQDFCLITIAQVGICSLDTFKYVFKTRFDLLGLTSELEDHEKHTEELQHLINNKIRESRK